MTTLNKKYKKIKILKILNEISIKLKIVNLNKTKIDNK